MKKNSELETGESFETIRKKFWILKAIVKVLGILLIIFGFLVTVLSYALTYLIEDFKDLPVPEQESIFLIAFSVGWLLFGGGFLICFSVSILNLTKQSKVSNYLDQYFKAKEKPEKSIRFFSFPSSRLLASVFLLILGYLLLFILTGAISHHQPPYR
ncbi:MAG: hypothetical protein HWN66_02140, partial [Candidatus Helarchaeota archaeon]|nr:hypothetical protein [Candidatus Helarchaeota archaeon]